MSEWKVVACDWVRDEDYSYTVLMNDECTDFRINVDPPQAWVRISATQLWHIANQVSRIAEGDME